MNTGEYCGDAECDPGETDCNGPNGTKRTCNVSGQWENTGEACQPVAECDAAVTPYQCNNCNMQKCVNGQWKPVSSADKPFLEDIKYCGPMCSKPFTIGVAATGAAVGLAVLWFALNRGKGGSPPSPSPAPYYPPQSSPRGPRRKHQ
jgi:hypothetical protein